MSGGGPRRSPLHRGRPVALLAVLTTATLGACGFPHDPDGTLERITGDALLVGVSENPPWTQWPDGAPAPGEADAGVEPSGIEVELIASFAESLDAEVVWVPGSEADLMAQLEEGELDVVVAGLEASTPWSSHAATTYPYAITHDDGGARVLHVMATRIGENDLLTTLEHHLLAEQVER